MNSQLSAGSTVETKCTRCREVLNHTIVAMVGEKIVRVECNTCHGVHAYHPVKTPIKPTIAKVAQLKSSTTPRKTKTNPDAADQAEWEMLKPDMDSEQAIPYDMNRIYRVKNLLAHPNFGLGIVKLVIPPNKIEVLFREGKKLLRCG